MGRVVTEMSFRLKMIINPQSTFISKLKFNFFLFKGNQNNGYLKMCLPILNNFVITALLPTTASNFFPS